MGSSYRESLERWLRDLSVQADTVIDLGGSQLPVKDRVKSWDVQDYYILDKKQPHKNMRKPDATVDINDGNAAQEGSDYVGIADTLFCLEVFEYVFRPEIALNWVKKLMIGGGRAYVTFPFFYPLHEPVKEDSLRYTSSGIQRLADQVGLKINAIIPRRPDTDMLLKFFSVERMRAAKGHDHMVLGYIVEFEK